jgi:riboflavin kinase / FMN adenylyltransferase
MTVLHSLAELAQVPGPVALAVGVFDGLHLGHQEVIRAAQEHARQHRGQAVVMSFEPHPMKLLRPAAAPQRLCGLDYRQQLLSQLGIDSTLLCPFDPEFAAIQAEDFIHRLADFCQPLGCISVGYSWVFGRGRRGDIHLLMDQGQKHDFAVYGVPPVRDDAGKIISSTSIREAVAAGDLAQASRWLGRPYALFGEVVPGRQLARQLGFPTANVRPGAELLPPFGVYEVSVRLADGHWHHGIANLGVRPTVAGQEPWLEVHLLNFTGDLYGQKLEVRLQRFLRAEQKFSSVEALREQILLDLQQLG